MRVLKLFALTLCGGALVLSAPVVSKANDWNKETKVTFKAPVEVPGMVLMPGTYVFKLLDSPSDQNIVQIYNATETHLYDTVLAQSAYRLEPTAKAVVTFEERAKGNPEAIKTWFYPGDNFGEEFVYPALKSTEIAATPKARPTAQLQAASTPAAQPKITADRPTAAAPQVSVTPAPNNQPTQMAELIPPSQPASSSAASPAPKPTSKKLPKTASPLPILFLAGLLSLAGSAGIHVFAKSA